ncbi:hypothetical protein AB0J83_35045 [Actinoplanes sp. NPDC049596]|uniref:hypothetical protein n=1 Tax=unclassified Actinoplanes TaxID=2626549 RepID=UPI003439620F
MDDDAAFDLYLAARAGAVDCTDAFDLATAVLESAPADRDALELASLAVECAPSSRPRMAELAVAVLATAGFEPGFAEEPQWLARLEDAMRQVNRDLAESGLPRGCRLRLRDGNAHAESWDGHTGTAQGIYPSSGAGQVSALTAVAEDVQDAVMHTIWSAWPVCPAHQLGTHARPHDEAAVWWCTGNGGHVVTPIGEWRDR